MGRIDHHIGIVIVFDDDTNLDLFDTHVAGINEMWRENYTKGTNLITKSGPHCNGFVQYTFNACGSKDGWTEKEKANTMLSLFFRAAKSLLVSDRMVLVTLPECGPNTVEDK